MGGVGEVGVGVGVGDGGGGGGVVGLQLRRLGGGLDGAGLGGRAEERSTDEVELYEVRREKAGASR